MHQITMFKKQKVQMQGDLDRNTSVRGNLNISLPVQNRSNGRNINKDVAVNNNQYNRSPSSILNFRT